MTEEQWIKKQWSGIDLWVCRFCQREFWESKGAEDYAARCEQCALRREEMQEVTNGD